MGRGYFKTVPKEEMTGIARLGGLAHRDQNLDRAWRDQLLLKQRYEDGGRIKDLAAEYGVTIRSMNRIIRGR